MSALNKTSYANTTDQEITSQAATYAAARNGTGSFLVPGDQYKVLMGQSYSTGALVYTVIEAFLEFDTSGIPSDAVITGVSLRLTGSTNGFTDTSVVLEAFGVNWTPPLSNAQFIPGANIGNYSRLATFAASGFTNTGFQNNIFTEDGSNFRNYIVKGGTTRIMIAADKTRLNSAPGTTAPTNSQYGGFASAENGWTGQIPELIITYTLPKHVQTDAAGAYAAGNMVTFDNGAWVQQTAEDMWFQTNTSTGATTVAYASQDPGAILRDIITKYRAFGGNLNYDNTTIELCGTSVSYTFNVATTMEGLKKCLELAPQSWYFYIDQSTNMVHFHQKGLSANHKFGLGREIANLSTEKRTEEIVNTIYFSGGPTGLGATNLFKQYSSAASIAQYGQRILRYSDNRVTVTATADTIANTILNNQAAASFRTSLEIVDNFGNAATGYDLESIKLGQIVGFQNFLGNTSSLWDVMIWDNGYWDYNIQELGTLLLQITRVDYTPGKITLALSTVPPDVNKRIEDINRALQALQTQNNPAIPAT